MAAPPVTPGPEEAAAVAAAAVDAAQSWWHWLTTAGAGIFGGGVVWGVLKSKVDGHERRITALEAAGPASSERLEQKIDRNHQQLVALIVDLARGHSAPRRD